MSVKFALFCASVVFGFVKECVWILHKLKNLAILQNNNCKMTKTKKSNKIKRKTLKRYITKPNFANSLKITCHLIKYFLGLNQLTIN